MEVVGDRKSTRRANLTIDRRQHLESMMTQFPQTRLRRLRQNRNVRGLVQDVSLSADDLMGVIFVKSGKGLKIPVPSMPGVYQLSPDQVSAEAEKMMEAVSNIAIQRKVPAQVSLETPMACGIGICFTCVARVRDEAGVADYRRTCVEGPVFDADRIEWD